VSNEIESVKPTLTVTLDDGDFIINSTGAIGKLMSQAVLPLAASAKKVVIISDGEMKVLKRNGNGAVAKRVDEIPETIKQVAERAEKRARAALVFNEDPDVQDQFAADLKAGVTGEQAMGESPSPTPGPSDPVAIPAAQPAKRKPQIFQDAAAPLAPELAEAEMDRLLAEAAQADQEAAKLAEDRRFQAQQAVQAGQEQTDPATTPAEAATEPAPRRRKERALATTGRPCGRCGGNGQIQGEAGFVGACPVCHGEGQVKTWDRSLKVR
jgi:hypothetical protein